MASFYCGIAFDIGAPLIGFILQYTANPYDRSAKITVQEGQTSVNYFSKEICDRLWISYTVFGGYTIFGGF